jgi:hypothetical protein
MCRCRVAQGGAKAAITPQVIDLVNWTSEYYLVQCPLVIAPYELFKIPVVAIR